MSDEELLTVLESVCSQEMKRQAIRVRKETVLKEGKYKAKARQEANQLDGLLVTSYEQQYGD